MKKYLDWSLRKPLDHCENFTTNITFSLMCSPQKLVWSQFTHIKVYSLLVLSFWDL